MLGVFAVFILVMSIDAKHYSVRPLDQCRLRKPRCVLCPQPSLHFWIKDNSSCDCRSLRKRRGSMLPCKSGSVPQSPRSAQHPKWSPPHDDGCRKWLSDEIEAVNGQPGTT